MREWPSFKALFGEIGKFPLMFDRGKPDYQNTLSEIISDNPVGLESLATCSQIFHFAPYDLLFFIVFFFPFFRIGGRVLLVFYTIKEFPPGC